VNNFSVNLILVAAGAILATIAYGSTLPILAAALIFIPTYFVLLVTPLGGRWEQRMFTRQFAVGFAAAGVAGIYAELLSDPLQLSQDAGHFFRFATQDATGLTLAEIRTQSNGSIAIVIWREIYDALAILGFPKARYIGVVINVTVVALSGVFLIKMARYVYGEDKKRFHRLIILVSFCGIFWLFAAVHLRDGFVLLTIVISVWVWAWYLQKPGMDFRVVMLVVCSVLFSNILPFLRAELFFAPLALGVAGTAALILGAESSRLRWIGLLVGALGLLLLIANNGTTAARFLYVVQRANIAYFELARSQSEPNSLGMALILDQPVVIRLVLGTLYLYVFPIPFWVGFQIDNVYNLFISLNTIFFYFLIPLLVLGVAIVARNQRARTPGVFFHLFIALGFSVAVALTSLEMRHIGPFLMSVLLIALLPDLTQVEIRRTYQYILVYFLVLMGAAHIAWLIIKV